VSEHIKKRHNKNLLLYHLVCPAYRRKSVFTSSVSLSLKESCLAIQKEYEIYFVEIGTDKDHVHFLIQSVPMIRPSRMVQIIKSITARDVFHHHPAIKKLLRGGSLWTSGYYINTVGHYGNEQAIQNYVKKQGTSIPYTQLHRDQLTIFDGLL